MARNNTIDTTMDRETFLLDLLRRDPDMNRTEVQESFKAKFGGTVNARTLNQLREQARTEAEAEAAAAEQRELEVTSEAAEDDTAELLKASARAAESIGMPAPAQKAKAAKGARLKHVFVEATKEQLEFLERVVIQFQDAGVTNLKVDSGTERWMVFSVESK